MIFFLFAVPPPTFDHRWSGMSVSIGPGWLFVASHVDARVLVAHESAGADPIFHPSDSKKIFIRIFTLSQIFFSRDFWGIEGLLEAH